MVRRLLRAGSWGIRSTRRRRRNRKKSYETALLMGKRAQRIPSWPGVLNSNKGWMGIQLTQVTTTAGVAIHATGCEGLPAK